MALSGRFRSSLIIGGQGIRARKMRTFLSMVSLFLGVLAVVVVQAAAAIGEKALIGDVELMAGKDGTRQLYLEQTPTIMPIVLDSVRGRSEVVATTAVTALIGEPGVRAINEGGGPFDGSSWGGGGGMICDQHGCRPDSSAGKQNAPQGKAIELRLTGMTGDIRTVKPFRPVAGEWLNFASAPSLAPRLVLNKEAAKGFAEHRVPAELTLPGSRQHPTPRIIGVVDDGQQQPTGYVRHDELTAWMPPVAAPDPNGGSTSMEVFFGPGSSAVEKAMTARLIGAGIAKDSLSPSTADSLARMTNELSIVRWIFTGLAALVLLIGVAAVLNVGLATVGERIEEFALRRAVGTPRVLLAGIVLAETLLTGLITAAAAIGVAMLALKVASALFGTEHAVLADLTFPWEAGIGGVIAGLAAGILGGLVPAIRAARIPIATVMRA